MGKNQGSFQAYSLDAIKSLLHGCYMTLIQGLELRYFQNREASGAIKSRFGSFLWLNWLATEQNRERNQIDKAAAALSAALSSIIVPQRR